MDPLLLFMGICAVGVALAVIRIWQLSRLPSDERTELIQAGRFWSRFSQEEQAERKAKREEINRLVAR